MMDPYLQFRRGPQIENILRRQEFFRLVIDSHQRWMRDTTDHEMKMLHGALITSMKAVMEQYDILIEQLQHLDSKPYS
jgi:hypothetical protein